jgi:hypothetical protein
VPVDPRDQYALARAMIGAEGAEPDAQPGAYARVHDEWDGKRYRWEMMRVEAFCTAPGSCLFAPFDLARFEHPTDFAFLPRVVFADGEHVRATTACEAHGAECVVTLEATLSDLVFELGAPTAVELTDAHFLSARRRRDGEHFLSRPARDPSVRGPLRHLP